MCGIAGYSLRSRSRVGRTLAAQALLAAIAERGADAVGYAYRGPDDTYATVVKQRTPASQLLERVSVPDAGEPAARPRARLHQGPSVDRRQQPPGAPRPGGRHPQRDHHERRRAACPPLLRPRRAAHDRRLRGDLRDRRPLARTTRARSSTCGARWRPPGSTSASPASSSSPAAAAARSGSATAATASSSPRRRPRSRSSSATASLKLRKREMHEGMWLALEDGQIARRARFRPDVSYHEDNPLPSVRAPQERDFCLRRLAALAAAWRCDPAHRVTRPEIGDACVERARRRRACGGARRT